MSTVGSILRELRRRGVLQSAAMYIVAAWVLLQAADVLFPGAGIPDSAIRYVFLGVLLGFPLIMVFGWMYDIGAGGITRTPPRDSAGTQLPLRRSDVYVLGTLGSLCVALVLGVTARVLSETDVSAAARPAVAGNSIAVLPFVNMSGDPDQEYFGDGIAEELLNQLAGLPSLRVAARTSSFYFKDKEAPIHEIGRQLGVATILEGSVRKSGERIRVTAQLINADDGYHLWSETYDRASGDILDIQDEIARSIADALEIKVLEKDSRRLAAAATDSVQAYDLYLLAQHYRELRNQEGLDRSIALFEQALVLDERFAPAYAGLAATHVYRAYFNNTAPEVVAAAAEPLLAKALELEPGLAAAYVARGSLGVMLRDFERADPDLLRAIELSPSHAGAWTTLGFSRLLQSRLHEADAAYEKALVLDPLNASIKFNAGALMMLTGDYTGGLEAIKRVRELAPQRAGVETMLTHWSATYGDYEEAMTWAALLAEREPGSADAAAALAQVYGSLGMWEPALSHALIALNAAPGNLRHLDMVASLYDNSGDHAGFRRFVDAEYDKIDRLAPARYSPTNKARYFWHGYAAILEGSYEQALDDMTDAAGGTAGVESAVYDQITPMKYMAYSLQRLGRSDEAEVLLQRCLGLATGALEQGWATPSIYYRTAQIHALLNSPDAAVARLQEAVARGWLMAGALETDPLWSTLQNDVRFQAIVAEVNEELRIARERAPIARLTGGT